ncbi:ankyrin repeat-containing domain protein [Nemania abortiva]|nr:ankyrin repeat-containing domain protein [Nemania abortiva]
MEAIGLGANVAAFVVIASHLSKVLYTAFSTFRSGPDNVRRVAGHLLQLHRVLEQLRLSPLACHDTALARHVGLCISDLNSMADPLLKSFLNEKKLDVICEQIIVHTSTLNFHLGVLQSNTTHELLSNIHEMNQLINGLNESVEKQMTNLGSIFAGLESTIHIHHEQIESELASIRDTVKSIPTIPQGSADSTLDLLVGLKGNVLIGPAQNTHRQAMIDDKLYLTSESDNGQDLDARNGSSSSYRLIQSITRLCCLVKEKNLSFDTNAEDHVQAEEIIEDLQMLVSSAQKYGNTDLPIRLSTSKQSTVGNKAVRSDLRRFCQAFGQFKLVVNQEDQGRNGPSHIAIRQKWEYTRVSLGNLGTLSLMIRVSEEADYIRSRVFAVVRSGTLREFQTMLKGGEATLRDYDENGANLLFHALLGRQMELFRFLLENGVDVDYLKPLTADSSMLELCVFMLVGSDQVSTVISFSRLLLEAGADPIMPTPRNQFLLKKLTVHSEIEIIRFFWNSELFKLFVGIDNLLPSGVPPLFACMDMECSVSQASSVSERLRTLLDAGANVHVRDAGGRSCLHEFVLRSYAPIEYDADVRDRFLAIRLLVERGADVYAVDKFNRSVCEVAYNAPAYRASHGGFAGDLWDAALQSCGYDIAAFRKNHQRRARYIEDYTRRHFEMLWEGMEDQCPYWDNNPVGGKDLEGLSSV